jgi:hypothetical protein
VGPGPDADLSPDALLAEPPDRSPEWIVTTYARVACASHGLVGLASGLASAAPGHVPPAWAARLAAAGAPLVVDVANLERARASHYPALERVLAVGWGKGCPAPSLVLVGDRDPRDTPWPLMSRSGVWLFRALRELGHDELSAFVCNAFLPDGRPAADELRELAGAFAPHGATWVALGTNAAGALKRADLPHVAVTHPQHARRFAYDVGPQGYAKRLAEDGVPVGRWRGAANPTGDVLPVVACDRAPPWIRAGGLPTSAAFRPRSGGKGKTLVRHARLATKIEEARRLFVTGRAPTIKDAVAQAGLDAKHYVEVQEQAGVDEWERERAGFVEAVRASFYREAVDAEARALTASRRFASASLALALESIHGRLSTGDLVPKPVEAESLARTAALLSERGAEATDAEVARIKALPLVDQARAMADALRAQFGDDVLDRPAAPPDPPAVPPP